jgi:hypothetical protein
MPRKDVDAKHEYDRQWHQDHKEEVKARKAARRQEDKERGKTRYQTNKAAIDAANKRWMRSIRDFIYQQKVGKTCVRCGIVDPRVLDFHHLDPTTKEISLGTVVQTKVSKRRIIEEIAKCELVCANCHRILHWEERNGE